MDAERGFKQERRKDDVKNEIVREHRTRFEPRRGKTDAGNNEPYRVGQMHASCDDRNENGDAKEANGVSENSVHQITYNTLRGESGFDRAKACFFLERTFISVQVAEVLERR